MTATTASNLVERFDAGKDVLDYFDTENPLIEEPDPSEPKQVSITIPPLAGQLARPRSRA